MSSDDTGDTDDRDSTDENGSTRASSGERSYSDSERSLAANRLTVVVGGVFLVGLGLLAVVAPFLTGIAISLVLGAVLVVGALAQIAAAFAVQAWRGAVFGVLLAVLYGAAGIAMLANPTLGLVALTLVVGVFFLAEGLVQLVMGLLLRANENAGWLLASGVVAVLLSSLILLEFPSSADWAVGLLFGVNLLTSGLAIVMVATAAPSSTEVRATRHVGEPDTGSS